jgi:hypothetical protein
MDSRSALILIIGPALPGLALLGLYARDSYRKLRSGEAAESTSRPVRHPGSRRDSLRRSLEHLRRMVKNRHDRPGSLSSVPDSLIGLYVMLTVAGAIWVFAIVALCRWLMQR